jgi:antitoxin component YwqK of YwqJK toxin-antitoxin module
LVAVLALIGAGTMILRLREPSKVSPPSAPPPREALLKELERRDGRLFAQGESNAFTGLVLERYDAGSVRSRSEMQEGVLHGISEGWYTNGVLQIQEHFTNGVSHGLRRKYHENGSLQSEGTVAGGRMEGTFRRWHTNGALAEEIPMVAGEAHGEARSFHPDGSPKARALIDHGKLVERKDLSPSNPAP